MKPESQHVFLFERGILGWSSLLGEWANWPNEAVAWVHRHTPHRAQTLVYFVTALLSGITRPWRARQFAKLVSAYKGCKIHIIAHSEGTATVLYALRYLNWPEIETLHLLCGACDADFGRSGLNVALLRNRIGKVFCYIADSDKAMLVEDTVIGLLMFGIRWNDVPLGLSGPRNVHSGFWYSRVFDRHWEGYGHSDCFLPKNFNRTMMEVIANSRAGRHEFSE